MDEILQPELAAQKSFFYLGIIQDRISRSVEMVLSQGQNITSIGYIQRSESILLNDEDANSLLMQALNLIKHIFGNFRGESGRWLI